VGSISPPPHPRPSCSGVSCRTSGGAETVHPKQASTSSTVFFWCGSARGRLLVCVSNPFYILHSSSLFVFQAGCTFVLGSLCRAHVFSIVATRTQIPFRDFFAPAATSLATEALGPHPPSPSRQAEGFRQQVFNRSHLAQYYIVCGACMIPTPIRMVFLAVVTERVLPTPTIRRQCPTIWACARLAPSPVLYQMRCTAGALQRPDRWHGLHHQCASGRRFQRTGNKRLGYKREIVIWYFTPGNCQR